MMNRVAPLAGLVLVVCGLFPEVIFRGGTFFFRDLITIWYPQTEFAVRAVAQGVVPWWNPYVGFGAPALADPTYALAYPPTWLNLVLQPWTYIRVFVVCHTLFAALGVYLLAKRWGLDRLGAFVSGACFVASGPFMSFPSMFVHFAGLAWVPWVVWAFEGVLISPGPRTALLLGGVGSAQTLTGSSDMCLMSAIMAAARILAGASKERGGHAATSLLGSVKPLILALLVALGLSAVQWLPTAAILRSGSRLQMTQEEKLYWSVHPALLTNLIVDLDTASLATASAAKAWFEGRDPFLYSLLLGVGTIVAAGAGLATRRSWVVRMLGWLALFCLCCALGRYFVVYPLLAQAPPLSLLRYPVKYTALLALAVALLAGFGVETWAREPTRGTRVVAIASLSIGILVAVAGLFVWLNPDAMGSIARAGAIRPLALRFLRTAGVALGLAALLLARRRYPSIPWRAWAAVTVALMISELVWGARGTNRVSPEESARYRPSWVARLPTGPPPPRLYVKQPDPRDATSLLRANPDLPMTLAWEFWYQDMVAPQIGGRWALAGSFDSDLTSLTERNAKLLSGALVKVWGTSQATHLLRIGSVDAIVAPVQEPWLGREEFAVPSVGREPLRIYGVGDALPRAYLVSGRRVAARLDASIPLLLEGRFDPTAEALFEDGSDTAPVREFQGSVHIRNWGIDRLELEVSASHPSHLVVTEAYDAGWKAAIDGEPATVRRANLLFRSVDVPAGQHRVLVYYRPASVVWGAAVTVASVVAVGIAALALRSKRPSAG